MTYKSQAVQQDIFVLKDLHQALIRLPAIEALSLVTRINSIRETTDQIIPGILNSFKDWDLYQESMSSG